MKSIIYFFALAFLFVQCKESIKNESTIETEVALEETPAVAADAIRTIEETPEEVKKSLPENVLGYWVGWFNPKNEDKATEYLEETYGDGYYNDFIPWGNKINVSIDYIGENGEVKGHSVVANNDRPFTGTYETLGDGALIFRVKEPGDDVHDGEFWFTIRDSILIGDWTAYEELNIKERTYRLEPVKFAYNPEQKLDDFKRYVDWDKFTATWDEEYQEFWKDEYSTTTDAIFELNPSNDKLTRKQVENLKQNDIRVLRNSIFARHGYSFKDKKLRAFFDTQGWYVPVHADITRELTQLEKDNIAMLLEYEEYAEQYYDRFGR